MHYRRPRLFSRTRNGVLVPLASLSLARASTADTGETVKSVEMSYRLADVVTATGRAGSRFGKPFDAARNELNIEGIAITGSRLWVGLRAPVDDGKAYPIGASIDELFAQVNPKWTGVSDGKAEVIAITHEGPTALELVVMFDSMKNGGRLLYRVKLP